MILSSDFLKYINSPSKFEYLCLRLAWKKFPELSKPFELTGDEGMDGVVYYGKKGNIVLQCKYFIRGIQAAQRKQTLESLAVLNPALKIRKWILCLPVNPPGAFLNWLNNQIRENFKQIKEMEIWDATKLVYMLDKNRDVRDAFFYPLYKEFVRTFRTDELELISFRLSTESKGWIQSKEGLFIGPSKENRGDPILDIIVRNNGMVTTILHKVTLEVNDVHRVLRGIPGARLLNSLKTYNLPLDNATKNKVSIRMDPEIEIAAGGVAKFRVRLTEPGFAWIGAIRLSVVYGTRKILKLPWVRIST
ncbi:hypothetical protein KAX97_02970 [candidate division WOR-3 bacterium]|nr:hypothetical protein [candidate division WOR-3 bacterium]